MSCPDGTTASYPMYKIGKLFHQRSRAGGDELLQPGDVAVADQQSDRLDALTLGADHQPFDVVIRMILGLILAEERGEPLVEVDQLLGRGAHVIRCHGGPSLTK